ncbi:MULTISPECIES: hypothetical protein [unclassified Chelatococcus]|uniref:hypothetical protein n=1 Tax=unclassified Chelatococcus TaxID=2638111 RepID=UPI001BCE9A96|nr:MULTISPECIES: hypothetical protein [unclassified Chelatococcus]CAH1660516.1 conserved hypothetical protein [Hyphomicrobiales bacterium]MBS7741123.1 hypothetical protein [Chelatococcus sp. HY11]MBX3545309.1 hypothetical protein [Chelatococcus sp.]MCO5077942.1 hypothetical protein [Chelatococcus sp.]CAH1683404.1 conserved hypothetical protein [Hyphomicrobiales bacterium]
MIEMAKVEAAMLFALGFLAAALLVAMLLPAFNRRAQRLMRRRLESQLPLTRQEIFAERDHLRAEFAVAVRRLERETEKQRSLYAASQATLTERNKVVINLEDALAKSNQELEATKNLLAEARNSDASAEIYQKQTIISELERVLRDTRFTVTEREAAIAALDAKIQDLMLELDRRRITVVELETRNEASALRKQDAEKLAASARDELGAMQKRAETAEKKLSAEKEKSQTLTRKVSEITLRQDNQSSLVEMFEANEIEFAAKLTEATVASARLRTTIEQREATIAQAEARIAELEAQLANPPALDAPAVPRARKSKTAANAAIGNGSADAGLVTETAKLRERIEEIGDAFLTIDPPKPKPAPRAKRQTPTRSDAQQTGDSGT